MRNLKIIGYGKDKGNKILMFGKNKRHRMDKHQSHFTMSKTAIDQALEKCSLTIEDMDLIVFASAIGYQPIPCSAALISREYGTRKPIPCMDINTTCTSFISALDTVSYLIDADRYKRVLILTAETASLGINPKQKESFELFSDAAAAFIIEKATERASGVLYGLQQTWVEGAHDTEIRGGLSSMHARHYNEETEDDYLFDMKGPKVLRLVAKKVPDFITLLEKESGYSLKDIDMIIPHQASRALPLVMAKLGVPEEGYMNYVQEYGNMIAASVPYMLALALDEGLVKEGSKVLLFGTAAGLTISGLILLI
ncbi:MAG: hypothetical protein JEY99_04500 [Spirochaetales bacterium]|nr:hypothetical protein [Spirochaetales bacterium]